VLLLASVVAALVAAASASAATSPVGQAKFQKWDQAIQHLPVPGKGCFTASYPRVQWQKAACRAAPDHPYAPAQGHRPQTVGNRNDFAAEVSGLMSSATGTVASVSSGTTETGLQNGTGSPVANTFALQLNVKPFTTTTCAGTGNPTGCQGWQQFIYSTTGNDVFIQYWLLRYNAACPTGWKTFQFPMDTDIYCWRNAPTTSASTLPGGPLTAPGLAGVTLTGTANASGNDTAVLIAPSGHATSTGVGNMLGLGSAWTGVEFAVVGDCCSSQAMFSPGTTINVHTTTHNGTRSAPMCVVEGFTGETNNLNLSGTPALPTQASPTIASQQTNSPGTAASCATASGLGDTHLETFRNLLYDFQASGDFELATTGPQFIVQARQVSGAPAWPNAAVNQAVAARIGPTSVAVCTAPTRLEIDGRQIQLANGLQRNLPGGGDVTRYGAVYLFRGANGDSVRAQVNAGAQDWIDVSVGLGQWPVTVHGLLANAGAAVNTLESRGGAIFTAPFAFDQLYGPYGNSWRVTGGRSLLSPCGKKVVTGVPKQLIYASNLPDNLQSTARSVCVGAGVEDPALLDACTVDVAVLHTKAAATVYRSLPAPVTWGKIAPPKGRLRTESRSGAVGRGN
jgi:hypothetical protein